MRVDLFDFELPEELIALRPASPRDSARLLHVTPDEGLQDLGVADLPELLSPGDVLVFNDTKVIPARLTGWRTGRGSTTPKIEITLHDRQDAATWKAFARPARKLEQGDRICFGETSEPLCCEVQEKFEGGEVLLKFDREGALLDQAIDQTGVMPLPPYIASRRPPDDKDVSDYQTVYASKEGAVAAPTAGLHFTPDLLKRLAARGVSTRLVTLHVGAGTFLPVKAETTEEHSMHAEWGRVDKETADALNDARRAGHRIIAIGTTSLRLLESCLGEDGSFGAFEGHTDIFITPGTSVRSADMLMTNFHLPRSTLFMLVCAFAGTDRMKEAYAHAIQSGYRFYSYGDACLLHRHANNVAGGTHEPGTSRTA